MPAAQLLTAALERSLNLLLRLDTQSASRIRPLEGKRLTVILRELPWPLVFDFADQVSVMQLSHDDAASSDCVIGLSLTTLSTLQDSAQLTRLIKQGELSLEGDLEVAQQFADLIKQLDIDWPEHLSRYTGDVGAQLIGSSAQRVVKHLQQRGEQFRQLVSDAALEEKRVAAHTVAVDRFCQDVNRLRSDTARLEARLARLSEKLSG